MYTKDRLAYQQAWNEANAKQAAQEQQQAQFEQAAKNDEAMLKLKDYLSGQKQVKEAEQAKELFNLPGVDTARFGDVSLGSKPMSDALMGNKENTAERLETQALRNAYETSGAKDVRKKVAAIKPLQQMLKDPNSMDQRRLQTMLRNLNETGVATEKDVQGQIGTTWRTPVNAIGQFFGKSNLVDPYSSDQLKALETYLTGQTENLSKQEEAARGDIQQIAPTLAPTLHKQGKLPRTLEGVGMGVRSMNPPAGAPASIDPRARLEELRAKARKGK